MENTEEKKPVKVWPRDFIGSRAVSEEPENSVEVSAEPDLKEENQVDGKDEEVENTEKKENDYGMRKETILRVNPIHVEAKVIDIK